MNVGTRELVFTNASCFDLHVLAALLPAKMREQLAAISWSPPPSLQIGGALVLPAWTNGSADWRGELTPTLRLAGQAAVTNVTVRGVTIESAQAHFTRNRQYWDVSELAVVQAGTRLALAAARMT